MTTGRSMMSLLSEAVDEQGAKMVDDIESEMHTGNHKLVVAFQCKSKQQAWALRKQLHETLLLSEEDVRLALEVDNAAKKAAEDDAAVKLGQQGEQTGVPQAPTSHPTEGPDAHGYPSDEGPTSDATGHADDGPTPGTS